MIKNKIIMKNKKTTRVRVTRTGRRLILTLLFSLGFSCFLTSCNVTRTVTNESQYLQKGDTSIVIQTKTLEKYDASKKI